MDIPAWGGTTAPRPSGPHSSGAAGAGVSRSARGVPAGVVRPLKSSPLLCRTPGRPHASE